MHTHPQGCQPMFTARALHLPKGLKAGLVLGLWATTQLAEPSAMAATATGVMTVTATVAATCVVGASSLAFPTATSAAVAAGNVDAAGTVSVNCTTGSAYTVSLGAGTGTGATVASRKMKASTGNQLLNYSVYTSEARTSVWGDGTATSGSVTGIGTGANQTIAAYGRIFSGQVVPAATYSDTLNVTITY